MARPKGVKPETIKWIRDLYSKGGHTQHQLAKKFDLSQSTVCKIINNEIHPRAPLEITGRAEAKLGLRYGNQE